MFRSSEHFKAIFVYNAVDQEVIVDALLFFWGQKHMHAFIHPGRNDPYPCAFLAEVFPYRLGVSQFYLHVSTAKNVCGDLLKPRCARVAIR